MMLQNLLKKIERREINLLPDNDVVTSSSPRRDVANLLKKIERREINLLPEHSRSGVGVGATVATENEPRKVIETDYACSIGGEFSVHAFAVFGSVSRLDVSMPNNSCGSAIALFPRKPQAHVPHL